ncbi:MAG: ABC-F family ATP-binding cassette domain-containing protein, partial [Actinomycetaceae bacterium]|nr:ABC-F family ATP-binding cassette domain-containing protein [Actinomycetaceae bacterium]
KAVAAQNMAKRAHRLLEETEEVREADKVAHIRFPAPLPCGHTPIMGENLSKSYGEKLILSSVNIAVDKGSRIVFLGENGSGKTTLLKILAGALNSDSGTLIYDKGTHIGYYAQEHENINNDESLLENVVHVAPDMNDTDVRKILGSFLFTGDAVHKKAKVLSGGEKTRLSLAMLVVSGANVLLLDEPTNNLDPASREKILDALSHYEGAVILVTHDEGAVKALHPDRVFLLPDGDEDLWSDDYLEFLSAL